MDESTAYKWRRQVSNSRSWNFHPYMPSTMLFDECEGSIVPLVYPKLK